MDKEIRKLIIEAAYHAGHGHIPSALSIVEILDKTLHENDINHDIYNLVEETLHALNNCGF